MGSVTVTAGTSTAAIGMYYDAYMDSYHELGGLGRQSAMHESYKQDLRRQQVIYAMQMSRADVAPLQADISDYLIEKPKTFHAELSQETDEWLKDVL